MKEIFVLFWETRGVKLRNLLVELNIGLARKVAHRMKANCNLGYQDLFELATMGLIKAVERYNPEQRFFTSFAMPYIKGEIQHYLRDKLSAVRIPRSLHELNSKIKKVRATLAEQLGYRPNNAEVALYLGVSKTEIEEATKASQNQKYVWSLDSVLRETEDLTLGDSLVAQDIQGGSEVALESQSSSEATLDRLRAAITGLNNPAIDLIFLQNRSLQEAQKSLKLTEAQTKTLALQGIGELAQLDICDLDEAVQILSESADLHDFEAIAGYLLPSGSMAFLQDWLIGQLAA